MLKTQDVINKANEDFVKFKARLMHIGKEQIFQQSDKISFAKKLRRVLSADNVQYDNFTMHAIIDMENVYDVFYKDYKEMQEQNAVPLDIELDNLFMKVIHKYSI